MEYIIKEKQDGSVVTVRDLQLKLLVMLKEVDRVCKKNNIEYFLAGGSCLGAVRHQGFIPWDDDVDIAMSRSEYKRFIKALDKDLSDKYVYHCYEKSKKYNVLWPAMKIRMKDTYIREMNVLLPNKCKDSDGIFVDVFIYDHMSNNRILDFPLRFINTLLMPFIVLFDNIGINPIPLKEIVRFNAIIYGKMCKKCKCYADDITWTFRKTPYKYLYTDIYPVTHLPFEDTTFPVPGNYKEYCRKNYGPNYMQPPKENKRFAKHTLDINLESNEPDKDVAIPNKKVYIIMTYIGLALIVLALILMRDISFVFAGLGIVLIGISMGLFMHCK